MNCISRVPGFRLLFHVMVSGLLLPITAHAQDALATIDLNTPGVVAEVTECKRKAGVLSLKVRFRNTAAKDVAFYAIVSRNYDDYYVTAGEKKYFVLRDSEQTPLASPADSGGSVRAAIPAGATWTWWAKYPAPPADVTTITYFTPLGPPLEDVPVTDL